MWNCGVTLEYVSHDTKQTSLASGDSHKGAMSDAVNARQSIVHGSKWHIYGMQ